MYSGILKRYRNENVSLLFDFNIKTSMRAEETSEKFIRALIGSIVNSWVKNNRNIRKTPRRGRARIVFQIAITERFCSYFANNAFDRASHLSGIAAGQ